MAQERSTELAFTPPASSVTSAAPNDQSAMIDNFPSINAPHPTNHSCRDGQEMAQVNSGPKAGGDDEVQFVFSAPRRRKRKRKRLEFSSSPSILNQCSVPPTDPPPKRFSTTQWDPLRRRSLGVLEQLESCHIGTRESKDNVVRRNSLPVAPSAIAPLPKAQASWLHGHSYASIQAVQLPSQSASVPWWNKSKPLRQTNQIAQTNTVKFPDWRPLYMDNSASKKRRLDGKFQSAQAQRLSKSSQISPRTTPVPTLSDYGGCARDSTIEMSDMLWSPDLPSLPEPQPSNKPMFSSWSDFDWNAFNNLDTTQRQPQPVHQSMPINTTLPNTQRPAIGLLQQLRIGQFEEPSRWQQNIPGVPAAPQVQHRPAFESFQFPRHFQANLHQTRPQQSTSHRPTIPLNPTSPSSQLRTAVFQNPSLTSRVTPNLVSQHQGAQSRREQASTEARPAPSNPQSLPVAPSDLLRKPSLYKIPAWPSTPEATASQIPTTISQFQSRPQTSYMAHSQGFQSSMNFSTTRLPSNSMQPENHPSKNFESRSDIGTINAPSSTPRITSPRTDTFEISRPCTSRKHCPNLIVDIAETCQDLFPFAEVAERHSVPTKKVFDTFSAIIQLPLLRNADDRRRHGSLGKQRMREYRDAKKAMEKAQEAERKAQMKAMRARVEEAEKRGKGQANPSRLLKTAVLNNASQMGSIP